MQKTTIIGNVGKSASIQQTNNRQVINFSVAVTESYLNTDNVKVENTTWYNCSLWREANQSTKLAAHLLQGTKVYVEGKPSVGEYTDKNGVRKFDMRLQVGMVELLGSPKPKDETTTGVDTEQQPNTELITEQQINTELLAAEQPF